LGEISTLILANNFYKNQLLALRMKLFQAQMEKLDPKAEIFFTELTSSFIDSSSLYS